MEIITESELKTTDKKEKMHKRRELKVPDWNSFEEELTPNYGDDDIFVQAMLDIKVPKKGGVYDSTLVGETPTHYLLDANFKDLVRVPKNTNETNFLKNVETGDDIRVVILDAMDNSKSFSIEGSVAHIYKDIAFQMLENMPDDYHIDVTVDKLTGAGYNCTIYVNGCEIDAFLPQILAGVNKIRDDEKDELVGQKLEMCVESFVAEKGTWIVSRRKYLKQLIPLYIDNLSTDVEYEGVVTGTAKYGVFVEFNECLTGMIHRSNLVDKLKDNFDKIEQGDPITFKVKEVLKGNRLILTQVETTSLWDTISVGQDLVGTIKDHKPFGSLIVLDHETLGLIHSSEQTSGVKDLNSGDKVNVRVLAINRPERKIYLKNI